MLQCTKVLQCAQRRKRIGARRRAEIVGELGELPVRVSHEGADFVTIDRPAPSHGLSTHDAALAATWRDAWSSLGWLAAPLLRLAQ